MDLQILAKSLQNASKRGAGYPQESPERSKTAQGHPGAPQETLRRLQEVPKSCPEGPKKLQKLFLSTFWALIRPAELIRPQEGEPQCCSDL